MPIIREEDVELFLAAKPSREDVHALTVYELRLLCLHQGALEEEIRTFNKPDLIHLVYQFIFPEEAYEPQDSGENHNLEPMPERIGVPYKHELTSAGAGIDHGIGTGLSYNEQMQLLQMKVALEEAQAKRETESRLRTEAEIRLRTTVQPTTGSSTPSQKFNPEKAGKFVPKFDEKDPDLFFSSFERIACQLEWPREFWSLLVQVQFVGRARRTYLSLPDSEARDYELVKTTVLRAYALVPDAYRQQFRQLRKRDDQTYLEYARLKREALTRWLRAQGVDSFPNLVEVILMEEFLTSVCKEVSTHVAARDVHTIEEAARLSDKFILATGESTRTPPRKRYDTQKAGTENPKDKGASPSSPGARRKFKCNYCGRDGHTEDRCWKRRSLQGGKPEKGKSVHAVEKCSDVEDAVEKEAVESSSGMEGEPETLTVALVKGEVALANKDNEPHTKIKYHKGSYEPYITEGYLVEQGRRVPIKILRDTGAKQTMLIAGVAREQDTGKHVILRTVAGRASFPLYRLELHSIYYTGPADVAILPEFPGDDEVDLILGNDLDDELIASKALSPVLLNVPVSSPDTERLEIEDPSLFPCCAVTRSMATKVPKTMPLNTQQDIQAENTLDLKSLFSTPSVSTSGHRQVKASAGRGALIAAQLDDETLLPLLEEARAESGGRKPNAQFYFDDGVLFRHWMPPHLSKDEQEWSAVRQLVVPRSYREPLIQLSHGGRLAGHFGARNTYHKLLKYYFWPQMRNEVSAFVRGCHVCQIAGRPSKHIPAAPLYKVPTVSEPFSHLQVDVVGPLPRTAKGNEYIVTLVDLATRYVHGVAVRSVTANNVVRVLKDFMACFGVPCKLQTDGASYFTGRVFRDFVNQLGLAHSVSSPYHPESQGVLERSHRTLKATLTKLGLENASSWDEDLPYVLFCMRDTPSSSTGFSPFELVFGHTVRGPLCLLRERLLEEGQADLPVLDLVGDMRERLMKGWRLAAENISSSQDKSKLRHDLKARSREFTPGQEVLILIPVQGNPLSAKFSGPYRVVKRVSDTTYVVATPDRRRAQRLCHVNTMKPYVAAGSAPYVPVCAITNDDDENGVIDHINMSSVGVWSLNPQVKHKLGEKLDHLPMERREDICLLLNKYPLVIRDRPGRTTKVVHDIDVGDTRPIKQPQYRVNPERRALLRREIESMLEMGLIREGVSDWSSPCILVPKPDGSSRFCIDYRKVNKVVKKDSYPLPRIDDCIEAVGQAKFITKIDLLKGFWQIGLTPRAQQIGAFVCLGRTYLPLVLPFGLSTAPTAFQSLMNLVVKDVPNTIVYIDDILVYSDDWQEHLTQLERLFQALTEANLVINLGKCDFGHAQVTYLGHVVGCGVMAPVEAKINSILSLPPPSNKKALRRFLGMIGFYRRFIENFAQLALPLTNLLKGKFKFKWGEECQEAFLSLRAVLCELPVLRVPDFSRNFKLACDASNGAVGAVLLQEDDKGVDMPVAYFSKKLTPAQSRYSCIEKELLSLILGLLHFSYYVSPARKTVVYTDHKPITYLHNFQYKNARLTRWSLFLQNHNLDIVHVKGRDNVLADMLSRPN